MGKFSVKKRMKSFTFAWKGIRNLVSREHNMRIHCFAAAAVIVAGFAFGVSKGEWIAIIVSIAIVMTAEAFNTAIERIVDLVSPGFNEKAGEIKDLASGAVLITAIAAAIIGLIVFIPYVAKAFG